MTNRPPVSGEPRTEAGRAHLDYIRRWSEDEGATWTDFDTEEMGSRIRAIEVAASTGAALDVQRLAEWFHDKWESQGIACWHKNQHMRSWDCGRDAIEAAEYARLAEPKGANR